jgi:preprotein translocase subunit YajC
LFNWSFNVLISNAYAQAAGAADPTGGLMGLLPLILMFVVLWFLMIRPQMKRAKEHKAMVEALAKGDEVVTGGGIAGRVVDVGDSFVQIEIAPNTVAAVQKQAVATVLPKGTLKAL